jgi:hypothetical protein
MKRLILVLLVLLSLAWSACGNTGAPGTAPTPPPTVTQVLTSHYTASLSALNSSGVSGTVDFQVTGKILVVKMKVTGLVPNQKHFQHIHGNGTATCPTDAKGGVTLSEALTNIGPLAFDLQPYPLTDAQGRLNLTQTFTLDPDELANITPLTGHVMVLHGAFNRGQYDRFLPAACGPIQAA